MLVVPVACALLALLYAAGMRTTLLFFIAGASVFVLSTVLSLLYFISDDITGAGITEATLFHILYGFDGLDLTKFYAYAIAVIGAGAAVGLACYLSWRVCRRQSKRIFSYRPSRIIHVTVIGALSIFAVGVHPATLQTIDVAKEFYDERYASVLSEELHSFDSTQAPLRGKSLVYIYAESLEGTFLDERRFPGLTPELHSLEQSALSVRGIGQAPLTDWTIAGMVASQCGMPLATFRHNRNDLSDLTSFAPGATCLGDLLHDRAYRLAYVGGADLQFAGKGRFYADHRFEDITGLHEFRARHGEDVPVSKWGVYDDILFAQGLEKFRELKKSGEPFALFMLTLDTHAPGGHVTPACRDKAALQYKDGANPMLNAVKCSDRLISDFVRTIEAESDENIVIVVASDHWQMRGEATELLERPEVNRENLFLVRAHGIDPKRITKPSTTMDIAPTVLSLLGWDIDAMALGRNLLSDAPTLVEKYGRDRYYEMVKAWRMNLWKMWTDSNSGENDDHPEGGAD